MTMHLQELYVNMAEGLDKIPPVTTANSPRRYDGPIMTEEEDGEVCFDEEHGHWRHLEWE